MHTHRIYLSVAVLWIVSLACAAVPAFSTPDAGAISTAAAQTVIAGLTQNVPQATSSSTLAPTPTFTFTSEPPTITPTETSTPTPTLMATLVFTPSPLVSLISVSVPTNCRKCTAWRARYWSANLPRYMAAIQPIDTGISATLIRVLNFAGCGESTQR